MPRIALFPKELGRVLTEPDSFKLHFVIDQYYGFQHRAVRL